MLYTIEGFEDGYILTNAGHGVKFFATLQEIAAFLVEEEELLKEEALLEERLQKEEEEMLEEMYGEGAEQ